MNSETIQRSGAIITSPVSVDPALCEACTSIKDCSKLWGVWKLHKAAGLAILQIGNAALKMNEKMHYKSVQLFLPPSHPLFIFRSKNITLVAIGVGGGVIKAELETIAGDPTRVFNVASYNDLNAISSSLKNVIEDLTNGERWFKFCYINIWVTKLVSMYFPRWV